MAEHSSRSGNIAGATVEPTATLIAEGSAYGESEPTFAGYAETGFKYGEMSKLSDELLHDAGVDLVSLLAKLGTRGTQVTIDAAFVSGNGTSAPQGLVTGNATGVTAASSNAITADEIKNLYFSIAPGYRANACWLLADSTLSYLVDSSFTVTNGVTRPVVQFPDQDDPDGAPPMILGRPVYSDMNWPTLASGHASVYFGDIASNYLVRRLKPSSRSSPRPIRLTVSSAFALIAVSMLAWSILPQPVYSCSRKPMQRDYSKPSSTPRVNRNPYAIPGKRAYAVSLPVTAPRTRVSVGDTPVEHGKMRVSLEDVGLLPEPKRSIADRLRGKVA